MIWAALSILVVALVVTSSLVVLIALQFRRVLDRAFQHADSLHERAVSQQSTLLDRFMALDFRIFKDYQMAENAEEGGFEAPDESKLPDEYEEGEFIPRPTRSEQEMQERVLLEEDFPELMVGRP